MAVLAVQQTIKLFLIICIGIICTKRNILNTEKSKTLSDILIYVVTPALIINSFQKEFTSEHLTGLLWSFVLSLIWYALAILVTTLVFKKDKDDVYRILRYAGSFSNCGYIGIPLVSGLLGSEGLFYLTAHIVAFNLLSFTYGVWLVDKKNSGGALKVLLSPPIISSVIGFLLFIFRVHLVPIVADPISMLSDLNSPLAMLVAGVSIYNTDLLHIRQKWNVMKTVMVKILLIPAIYCVICSLLPASNIVRLTAIVTAACPCAALTIIFAVKYNLDDSVASVIFSATTILSVLTLPLIIFFASNLGMSI
jgi:predicted permease